MANKNLFTEQSIIQRKRIRFNTNILNSQKSYILESVEKKKLQSISFNSSLSEEIDKQSSLLPKKKMLIQEFEKRNYNTRTPKNGTKLFFKKLNQSMKIIKMENNKSLVFESCKNFTHYFPKHNPNQIIKERNRLKKINSPRNIFFQKLKRKLFSSSKIKLKFKKKPLVKLNFKFKLAVNSIIYYKKKFKEFLKIDKEKIRRIRKENFEFKRSKSI